MIHPLADLWRSTQAIAEGDYAQRTPLAGTSEFRAIASSFNAMAEKIETSATSMRQTNEELERAVARRTQELAATNRSLERANRLRQQFLADASHELRTPLSIMRSEAEITLRNSEASPDELRVGLDRVVRVSMLMGEIIEDMLQIARAEEPLLQTSIAPMDATAAVQNCVEDFRRVIEADGGRITLKHPAEALTVEGDETRLKQVIRIVVDNAVCYSSDAPHVDVTVAAEEGEALITVTDRGNGIAAEDIPHLFQRFRRGGRKAGSSQIGESQAFRNGHGLGLSIAQSIMEAMGGTISLSSQLHEGTTVSIRLPLMSDAALPHGTLS
jgi:signal transduction histidine kinase